MKYILIAGIDSEIVGSSIGAVLKAHGYNVSVIKLHTDVGKYLVPFVLNDGCNVSYGMGYYEILLDTNLTGRDLLPNHEIGQLVSDFKMRGRYEALAWSRYEAVASDPHETDAIQEWIVGTAKGDICLIDLHCSPGYIEEASFLAALRQLKTFVGGGNFCSCLVSPVWQNLSTETTRRLVERLIGLEPDLIVCRTEIEIPDIIFQNICEKISASSRVRNENIFNMSILNTIYRNPIFVQNQGIITAICRSLRLPPRDAVALTPWMEISDTAANAESEIIIALVIPRFIRENRRPTIVASLEHACYAIGSRPVIRPIDSEKLRHGNLEAWEDLRTSHCLVVAGNFSTRDDESEFEAIKWARENRFPFLGTCMGFRMAAVEYARNVLGITNADSMEFKKELRKSTVPIVIEMLEYQYPEKRLGGTMRLGLRTTKFTTNHSILKELYGGRDTIEERHRHSYEVNPDYVEQLEDAGLKFVGKSEDGTRMEILELDRSQHPYFVAVQYRPEYLSRPCRPSPPYKGLVQAARIYSTSRPAAPRPM